MDKKELCGIMRQNGVVCVGGAPFPVYTKFAETTHTMILNCAQYEPLLRIQTRLMSRYTREILRTFSYIGKVSGVQNMFVAVGDKDTDTVERVRSVIRDYDGLVLKLFDGCYPSGDEDVLTYEVTGERIEPDSSAKAAGVSVFNVETIYNAYRALEKNEPVTDKLVSVLGEVGNPKIIPVPIGSTVEDAVEAAGGVTCEDPAYLVGGPMWGHIGSKLSRVTKSTDAVIVLPAGHTVVRKKEKNISINLKRAAASCCQCMLCTDLCPRNLLGRPIEPHLFMRAAACKDLQKPDIFINTLFCSSCGLCEMYSCIQGLSPRTLITEYKSGLRKNGIEKPKVRQQAVPEERIYRKVPMERLTARLDLARYDKKAEFDEKVMPVKSVKIELGQHIGIPAAPEVKCGDIVARGRLIADAAEGMSAAVHAGIDGKVTEVNERFVIIEH